MWFNMADKKLPFPNPQNITPFKIEINFLAYTEFAVTWEIVKLQIEMWLFAPLMRNNKCVSR